MIGETAMKRTLLAAALAIALVAPASAQSVVGTAWYRFIVRLLAEGSATVHRIFLKGWRFGGFWQR